MKKKTYHNWVKINFCMKDEPLTMAMSASNGVLVKTSSGRGATVASSMVFIPDSHIEQVGDTYEKRYSIVSSKTPSVQ